MQRGGPSASTAEEQSHKVSSQTRRAKLAKGTTLLCSAASFAFNAGLGRRFFLHYHDPRALERNIRIAFQSHYVFVDSQTK